MPKRRLSELVTVNPSSVRQRAPKGAGAEVNSRMAEIMGVGRELGLIEDEEAPAEPYPEIADNPLVQGARRLRDMARLDVDPRISDSFAGEVAGGVGSLAQFAAGGGLAGAGLRGAGRLAAQLGTTGSLGAGYGAGETIDDARRFAQRFPELGLKQDEAINLAMRYGVGSGLVELLPLAVIFNKMPFPARERAADWFLNKLSGRTVAAAASEYAAENMGELIRNMAETEYNPDADVLDAVPESGEPAAVAAAIMTALAHPFTKGRGRTSGTDTQPPPLEAVDEQDAANLPVPRRPSISGVVEDFEEVGADRQLEGPPESDLQTEYLDPGPYLPAPDEASPVRRDQRLADQRPPEGEPRRGPAGPRPEAGPPQIEDRGGRPPGEMGTFVDEQGNLQATQPRQTHRG
ncbi:MAG: hypothetical protein OXG44_10515, partial [Gammaproteobacteria bacterium]|nr:hypothetical protein [Gammaproteobacteria bacterium]